MRTPIILQALAMMAEESIEAVGDKTTALIQRSAVYEDEDLAAKVIEIIERVRKGGDQNAGD